AGGGGGGRGGVEGAGDEVPEREGRGIGRGELQVGDTRRRLGGEAERLGPGLPVSFGQPREALPSAAPDFRRGAVAAEEAGLVVFVIGKQLRQPGADAGMPGEGGVLGAGEEEASAERGKRRDRHEAGQARPREGDGVHGSPVSPFYPFPSFAL